MISTVKELDQKFDSYTDQWYADCYFKYGSVEGAEKNIDTYISTPGYHRVINKLGIIKSVGRHQVSMSEVLYFFAYKALEPNIGIETLYKKMPLSFKTSIATLHRIHKRVLGDSQARNATAVLFYDENNNVLLGKETQNSPVYGKFQGAYSLPMTFSIADEDSRVSVLRVIQQEVLSNQAGVGNLKINSKLTQKLIPQNILPAFSLNILDIAVKVYALPLNFNINDIYSPKLQDFILTSRDKIPENMRIGITDILDAFWESSQEVPVYIQSKLNLALLSNL
jgi:hypothetical protein